MGKTVLIAGMVVLMLSLLMLVSCANEQIARPLSADTDASAAAQPDAPATAPAGTQDAGTAVPVVNATTASAKPTSKVNATSVQANGTSVAANATKTTSGIPGCLDTDTGKVYDIKGTVQYIEGNVSILKTDDCVGGDLREWYCDLGELAKEIIICSKGCTDGACNR